ncbi:hypothetical protein PM082_009175 [Marasmius tenuissimus]|nr:hypothetical protein PM082_009175 [Marasmius tenuissimus]
MATRDELFPTSITDGATRQDFMTDEEVYDTYVSSLPQEYRALAQDMNETIDQLVDLYHSAYCDVLNHESFENVYSTLLPFFEKAKESGVEDVLPLEELWTQATVTPAPSLKRSWATAQSADDKEYVDDSERAPKNRRMVKNVSTPNSDRMSTSRA